MTSNQEQFEPQVIERLRTLKDTPPRREHMAEMGRANFLAEARALAKQQNAKPVVSPALPLRLKEWFEQVSSPFRRKERFSMVTVMTSLVVVFSLLFGGAGATVYAAQGSMPDEALYGVKLLSEDVRLDLAGSPEAQIDLLMEYADRRNAEILALKFAHETALQNAGEETVLKVTNRYQEQVFHALKLAGELQDEAMIDALAVIGVHIRKHDRDQIMGHTKQPDDVDPLMSRLVAVRRLQIGLSELGIVDPLAFRHQLRYAQEQVESGALLDGTEPTEPIVPTDTVDCPECGPAGPFGPNGPNEEQVPSYGPFGPFGNQEGEGEGYGPGEQNQGEETQPDAGYGPSNGAGPDNGGEIQKPDDGYGKPSPAVTPEPSKSSGDSGKKDTRP